MVLIELDDRVSVRVGAGSDKPYAYTVISDGEEVVSYETSADIRKPAGRVGVRNVVFQRISGYGKTEIEQQLQERLRRHEKALNETMGAP